MPSIFDDIYRSVGRPVINHYLGDAGDPTQEGLAFVLISPDKTETPFVGIGGDQQTIEEIDEQGSRRVRRWKVGVNIGPGDSPWGDVPDTSIRMRVREQNGIEWAVEDVDSQTPNYAFLTLVRDAYIERTRPGVRMAS